MDRPPAAALAENLASVAGRIARATARSGRPAGACRLVAVTKSVGAELARALLDLGARDIAENRVDGLVKKREALGPRAAEVAWHMIGHLQRNKAKRFLETGAFLHSLESVELAEVLAERLAKDARRPPGDGPLRLLVEVNVAGEAQKDGVSPGALGDFLARVRALGRLEVAGLMCMAPFDAPGEKARPVFRELRALRDRHREHHPELVELSMGMSQDFEVAIEEGATLVRVGGALFEGIEKA
jgi:pyridoxal phosphate enzyme (YggS family)